jgi:hypothetical protein
MPQKRNPDVFEILRARAGRSTCWLQACMQASSRLTSGYHRDLQLVKAALFAGIDEARACLRVAARVVPCSKCHLLTPSWRSFCIHCNDRIVVTGPGTTAHTGRRRGRYARPAPRKPATPRLRV